MAKRTLLEELSCRNPEMPRKELHAMIMCGEVYVEGERTKDPKALVDPDADVAVSRRRYVSRGGAKLAAALHAWQIHVAGKVFVDAGASAGGFTDCLLQHGARLVHAVDVGYNQLDFRLRRDPRVMVYERTNVMAIDKLEPPAEVAVADLSFRSLAGVAPRLLSLVTEATLIGLIKPQFEWREPDPTFRGVVRDRSRAIGIVRETLERLRAEGAYARRVMQSPIAGRRGNAEFLALLTDDRHGDLDEMITELNGPGAADP